MLPKVWMELAASAQLVPVQAAETLASEGGAAPAEDAERAAWAVPALVEEALEPDGALEQEREDVVPVRAVAARAEELGGAAPVAARARRGDSSVAFQGSAAGLAYG
ncbi:MAG: hypothetical protein Q7T01_01000 [bacterium]|nr:hypothetical protein [bacterium]